MDWRLKALLQGALSRLPLGEALNYFLQRHVTRGVLIDAARLGEIVGRAQRHLEAAQRHWHKPLADALFYEFGAGWDLASPLSFWSLGVGRQVLVDIRNLLRLDVLNRTIGLFGELATTLPRRPAGALASVDELGPGFGIEYRAPCDARATGLADGSLDCITSSNTLEHIPPDDIAAILRECHRCLRDDGVMSFLIDYVDHYSYFDKRISGYHFLRFSDGAWRLFNPSLHYQNRLRHKDYLALFDAAGFQVLEERLQPVTAADLAALARVPLTARFAAYTPEELAVRDARVVLKKRGR